MGARLRIGGVVTTGDVELHLRAADWRAHGHASDPAYANVVLHVVLFPGGERVTPGAGGREIPILTLLPLLNHDLEEYAADAAVERLANHPLMRAHEALSAVSVAALRADLMERAAERWAQKVRYARLRIERLGWDEACHHTALEILGYSANRAPMLAVATAFPLPAWRERCGCAENAVRWIDGCLAQSPAAWRWRAQGLRPANHPRTRLRQYAEWISARPGWPELLAGIAGQFSGDALEESLATREIRNQRQFRSWRARLADVLTGDMVGGSRLDTLICDGFLPLLAARERTGVTTLHRYWCHWFMGDIPAKWSALLRSLRVIGDRDWPAAHGVAQGLLGWLLSEEKKQNFGDSAEGRGT